MAVSTRRSQHLCNHVGSEGSDEFGWAYIDVDVCACIIDVNLSVLFCIGLGKSLMHLDLNEQCLVVANIHHFTLSRLNSVKVPGCKMPRFMLLSCKDCPYGQADTRT